MENKAVMKVIVGEPGTGKSYRLIKKAIEIVRSGHEVFISVPSNKAKERLVNGIKAELNYDISNDRKIMYELLRSTHITLKNYHWETTILIDEVSMETLTDFYALLYKTLPDQVQHKIYAYGDIKQLPSIKDKGTLETLLRENETYFPAVKESFWSWVASDCYIGIKNGEIEVPEVWTWAINSVEIEALTENYRLKKFSDGSITSYGDEFYNELLNDYVSQDYENELIKCIEDDWLVLAPTYDRGDEANIILSKHYGQQYKKLAPFVRSKKDKKEVYLNPDCKHFEKLQKQFNFIKPFNENLKRENFYVTCFITVHSVQGGEVPNVALFLGDKTIDGNREFYSRNMLYTAMTRGGNWKLLGNKNDFAMMKTIDPEDPRVITSNVCNSEALSEVMGILKDLGSENILLNNEIYNLFLERYNYWSEKNMGSVTAPYTMNKIMKAFNPKNEVAKKLPIAYKLMYNNWAKEQQKTGRARGGKNSTGKGKTQQTLIELSTNDPAKFEEIKKDATSRINRNEFKAKYNLGDKYNVKNIIEQMEQSA